MTHSEENKGKKRSNDTGRLRRSVGRSVGRLRCASIVHCINIEMINKLAIKQLLFGENTKMSFFMRNPFQPHQHQLQHQPQQQAMFQQQGGPFGGYGSMMNHHYPNYQPQPYYNNHVQQAPPQQQAQQQVQQTFADPLLQNYNMSDTNYIQWVIYLLKSKMNVLMVCFDFDKTLVDIHTGGRWTASAEELATHVRPCFRYLIPELFKEKIHVCVATYSGQEQLIRDTLRIACNLW